MKLPKNKILVLFLSAIALIVGLAWIISSRFHKFEQVPEVTFKSVTPTIALGLPFTNHFAQIPLDKAETYVIPNFLKPDTFALEGSWLFTNDNATLLSGPGKVKLHFIAKKVFLSASNKKPTTIKTVVDSSHPAFIEVGHPAYYPIFESNISDEHVIEITVPDEKLEIYEFTFE